MGKLFIIYVLIIVLGGAYADIIFEPSTHSILPAGLYTIVIEGINEEELIRRVIVLH